MLFGFFFTLIGNLIVAVFRIPLQFTYFSIFARDLIPFFLVVYISSRAEESKAIKILFILFILYFCFLFFHSLLNGVSPSIILNQFRITFAIPLIAYIGNRLEKTETGLKFKNYIDIILKIFLIILCIESFFLITGSYTNYIQIINYKFYMLSKGTEASYGNGLLSFRLITPVFNASVGGAICAWLSFVYFGKKPLKSLIYFAFVILTLSKTGFLLLLFLLPFKRLFYFKILSGIIGILFLTFIDLSLVSILFESNEVLKTQLASVKYHLNGLKTGLEHFFHPIGIGNSGTILSKLSSTEIGRESAIGNISGSSGYLLLPLFISSIISSVKNKSTIKLISLYILIGLVNEATGPYYFWIAILIINQYAKNSSYNYI